MAKLRFSEDECDDALPVKVVLARERRIAYRFRIGGAGQPGMSSDEEHDSSCSSEGSDDDADDSADENVEIVDDEHGQEIVEPVRDPGQGTSSGSEANRDASVSVILTDPEVLDCSICLEPLSVPVFQCENGHIACSPCCTKLSNRCPSCSWPIGYNRCRAIEKVLESVKVSCQNTAYGCKETVSYSKKHDHEVTCNYVPCSCPHSNCNFRGSSKQLAQHFRSKHLNSVIRFQYNSFFPVHLEFNAVDKFCILEAKEGALFIVSSSIQQLGHAVTVCRIGPRSSRGHAFNLAAWKGDRSIMLQSCTENIREVVDLPSLSMGFLLIPNAFLGSSGQLKLELCIRGNNARPAKKIKLK